MKTCIKKTLSLIVTEYLYLSKSKIIYIVPLILFLLLGLNLMSNVNAVKQQYSKYNQTLERYKQQNLDINQSLLEDEAVKINFVSPGYLGQGVLDMFSLIIGPIVFGITAAIFNVADYKYKTIKIKAIESKWYKVMISKQLEIIYFISITTLIIYILFSLIGIITYKMAVQDLSNIRIGDVYQITSKTNAFVKIISTIFIISFFQY